MLFHGIYFFDHAWCWCLEKTWRLKCSGTCSGSWGSVSITLGSKIGFQHWDHILHFSFHYVSQISLKMWKNCFWKYLTKGHVGGKVFDFFIGGGGGGGGDALCFVQFSILWTDWTSLDRGHAQPQLRIGHRVRVLLVEKRAWIFLSRVDVLRSCTSLHFLWWAANSFYCILQK